MIILLNFVFEISEYVFSRRRNTNFPLWTPRQSLRPPPPLPPGLSGVVQGTDMNIYLWNVSNTMWFVRRSTSGCRIEDFVLKKVMALRTVPMGPMGVMCAIWTTLNPLPLKRRRTAMAHLSPYKLKCSKNSHRRPYSCSHTMSLVQILYWCDVIAWFA